MTSYSTITEAQVYFDSRLNTEPWDDADDNEKNKALGHATAIIDRLNFIGQKAIEAQILQFPRGTDTVVPTAVKDATAEIALALLDGVNPDLEYENVFMISQAYGGIRSSFDRTVKPPHLLAGIPSFIAWTALKPFLFDPLNIELHRTS